MAKPNIACNACPHTEVCRHIDKVLAVAAIANDLSFQCKFCRETAEQEKPAEDKYPGMSVDEVARLKQREKEEKERKRKMANHETGTCQRCGKKDVFLFCCDKCQKMFCEKCIEKSVTIDPLNEDSSTKEVILCADCSEKEYDYGDD